MSAIRETQFQLPGQTDFYRGKVRDVYHIKDEYLVIIASDRLSAFDRVLPKPIPYKGQVLNQLAAHFLEATEDIVPNWVLNFPDPRIAIGHKCEPFKVEMVIRGYLAGHAWREYREGKRTISGVPMPAGLKESDPFPTPIITPATKAETGHDEDISRAEIIAQGLVEEADYRQLEDFTKKLFIRGSKMAYERGLILVDTKYEFGKKDGKIYLIDEIHTPDSSRYFYKDGYEQRQREGLRQQQLSKEFVREWLMEHSFQGREGEQMPDMPDAFVHKVSQRYIELYEKITGQRFEPADSTKERLESCIIKALQELP